MKSFRLTNDIRDGIERQVLTAELERWKKARHTWRTAENRFAVWAFEQFFKKDELKLFYSCPKNWFETSYTVRVSINGNGNFRTVNFYENGDAIWRPHPFKYKSVLVSQTHEETKRFLAAEVEWEKAEEVYRETKNKVKAILKSFTSAGQLVLSWPEIETIVAEYAPFPRPSTAVGFPREQLNQQLGLPPGGA